MKQSDLCGGFKPYGFGYSQNGFPIKVKEEIDNIKECMRLAGEGIHYGLMIGKALAERVVFYADNGWSNGMRDAAKFWDGIGMEVIVRHLGERIKDGEHDG